MTRCVSVPGVVSEPQDERQAPASGHDVAPPSRPGLLHIHDEPRGGHRQPALPLPVPPAAAVLLPPGCRGGLGPGRHPFLQSPAHPRQLPDAVSPLPEAGAPVCLQTPIPVPGPDPRPRPRGIPLLLPGLSLQSIQRPLDQGPRLGLRLLPNQQD